MYSLPEKIENLVPYEPCSGEYRIRLDANESFLPPDFSLYSDALKSVSLNRYPDSTAEKLCESFAKFYGIDARFVTASNGSDEMLFILANCFLSRGDKVLTLSPDFSMYDFYASLAECNLYSMPKREDMSIDADAVIKELNSSNYRMLIFSNPCNPTSLGLAREDVRRIINSTDALVVLDEAYMDFWDESLIEEAQNYDNLIILRTCSKMMGMAALRVGFAIANDKITAAIRSVKSPYNVNSLSQAAAAAVLTHGDMLRSNLKKIISSRDWLYENMKEICENKGISLSKPATNFIFFKPKNAANVFDGLKAKGILIRKMGDYLRITAGSPEENKELIAAAALLL